MKRFVITIDESIDNVRSKFTLVKRTDTGLSVFSIYNTIDGKIEENIVCEREQTMYEYLGKMLLCVDCVKKDICVKFTRRIKKRFVFKKMKPMLGIEKVGHTYYCDRELYNDIATYIVEKTKTSNPMLRNMPEKKKEMKPDGPIKFDIPVKEIKTDVIIPMIGDQKFGITREIYDPQLIKKDLH